MTRGFGIDASVPLDVALEVAGLVERAGYGSFWVNGSPHGPALDIIEGALDQSLLEDGRTFCAERRYQPQGQEPDGVESAAFPGPGGHFYG